MTDRELMQQALDALESECDATKFGVTEAIRARLEQLEQEPVAWMHPTSRDCVSTQSYSYKDAIPLYTAPPQLEWQGLTDEDIRTMWDNHIIPVFNKNGINPFVFAHAIEAKLKEKNT